MKTVPQHQDYPALARRSHAPARANPNAGPRGLIPAAHCPAPPNMEAALTLGVIAAARNALK